MWEILEAKLDVLGDLKGKDVLEFGCGGGQWSIALARRGARPVGLDLSIRQLGHAARLMSDTGERFSLVNANAERVPFADESFDVFCDHGAMTFADPYATVPEVARVLRPGGLFAFNMASPLIWLCWGDGEEPPGPELVRDYFGMRRGSWPDTFEFQLPYGEWIRLFRANCFEVLDLVELRPPPGPGRPIRSSPRLSGPVGGRARTSGSSGRRDERRAREPVASPTRIGVSLTLALAAIAWGVVVLPDVGGRERTPPNVVVIVTDDQTVESIPGPTPVLPFLQERALDPDDHWVVFGNAFVNTPLCCPSRATMLTGLLSHETGVVDNDHGALLDEDATVASWPHDEGYHTGLVGKYLNGYLFDVRRRPARLGQLVGQAAGTGDEPVLRLHADRAGLPVSYGDDEADYSTDVLAAEAVEFVREAPFGRPFFLWFAPTALHPPWTPAPRHAGPSRASRCRRRPRPASRTSRTSRRGSASSRRRTRDASRPARRPPAFVRVAPGGGRGRPRRHPGTGARGELRRTVIVFTSDNGLAFGEHRWAKKTCAYDECVRVPLLVRMPGSNTAPRPRSSRPWISRRRSPRSPASSRRGPVTGSSLVRLLQDRPGREARGRVYAEWVGEGLPVPGWWALRTPGFAYVEPRPANASSTRSARTRSSS